MMEKYLNREQAGELLAQALLSYQNRKDCIVLALPRGGVPVAYEIAKRLNLMLDVFIVRKLGVPGHSELAMGAIAMGGAIFYNNDIIEQLHISGEEIQTVIAQEEKELQRREHAYRGNKVFPDLKNQCIILVDDGIATGASMRAAIKALRQSHVAKLVVAVPVADRELSKAFEAEVDEFICPLRPQHFYAVGAWYQDFSQTEDEEVYRLLKEVAS